jgi:hypothetical protein
MEDDIGAACMESAGSLRQLRAARVKLDKLAGIRKQDEISRRRIFSLAPADT